MPAPCCRNLLLAVHADVNDDSRSTKGLGIEVTEAILRAVEKTEVVHQSLGVQRPALAVTTHKLIALEARQLLAIHHRHTNLQVVTRHAFVIRGGGFAPERKPRATVGRIPRATRSREVFARWHVVLRRRTTRRRNLGFDLLNRCRNIEVVVRDEKVHRLVHQVL